MRDFIFKSEYPSLKAGAWSFKAKFFFFLIHIPQIALSSFRNPFLQWIVVSKPAIVLFCFYFFFHEKMSLFMKHILLKR